MKIKKTGFLTLFVLLIATSLPACVPFVDIYIVAEGGYQKVEQELAGSAMVAEVPATATAPLIPAVSAIPATTAKTDGFVYGGGLGVSLSLLRLYGGAEVNLVKASTDKTINRLPANTSGQVAINNNLKESWILNAMVDLGVYLSEDFLLFGRAGYVYTDSDIKGDVRNPNLEESAFGFGGGIEYEVIPGLSMRVYYLRHQGDREANEIRSGVVVRF